MQFLEDTVLHLLCSLVGKGHCEYVSVRIPVLTLQKKSYVCLCQVVGLT